MAVSNQKTIGVHKEPTDKNNIYACINMKALDKAALDLKKPSTFKLWLYFAKNQNGYEFELSAVAVANFCGITEKSYREAVKELIEKRYLVRRGETNTYDFYEVPREIEVPKDKSKVVCHTSTTYIH